MFKVCDRGKKIIYLKSVNISQEELIHMDKIAIAIDELRQELLLKIQSQPKHTMYDDFMIREEIRDLQSRSIEVFNALADMHDKMDSIQTLFTKENEEIFNSISSTLSLMESKFHPVKYEIQCLKDLINANPVHHYPVETKASLWIQVAAVFACFASIGAIAINFLH